MLLNTPCLLPGSLSLIPTFQAQTGVFFMNRESTLPPTIKTNLTDNVGFFLSFQGPHVEIQYSAHPKQMSV